MDARVDEIKADNRVGLNEAIWVTKVLEWDTAHPASLEIADQSKAQDGVISMVTSYLSTTSSKKSVLDNTLDIENFYNKESNFHGQLSSAALAMLEMYCEHDNRDNPGILYDIIVAGTLILSKALYDYLFPNGNHSRLYPIGMNTLVSPDFAGVFPFWINPVGDRDRVIREVILSAGYKALIEKSIPFDLNAGGMPTKLADVYPHERLKRFGDVCRESDRPVESIDVKDGNYYRTNHDRGRGKYAEGYFTQPMDYPRYRLSDLTISNPVGNNLDLLIRIKSDLSRRYKLIDELSNQNIAVIIPFGKCNTAAIRQLFLKIYELLNLSKFTFDAMVSCMNKLNIALRGIAEMTSALSHDLNVKTLELKETSCIKILKMNDLANQIKEIKNNIKSLASVFNNDEFTDKIKLLLTETPVSGLRVSGNSKESTRQTNRNGFFQQEHTIEKSLLCEVTFRDGTKLTWHTLDEGAELEKVREQYNDHLDRNMTSHRMALR